MTPHNYNTGLPGLILNAMPEDGSGVRALDLVKAACDRYSEAHTYKTLSEMTEAGRIARVGRGYYARVAA